MIKSKDYKTVIADGFEVLIDPRPRRGLEPVVGLKIDPRGEPSLIAPMPYETAKSIALTILATLLDVAPELFA